ncbi:hypothetical protein B0T13DRAFT_481717 [Neurospora crassa]|nr:hypothetical protein B0T13DRAFT_485047 [Neurospora crassa]KAK3488230.1 hypothetical protein B0T13DRAFT_481717 [Neurospora crassa]
MFLCFFGLLPLFLVSSSFVMYCGIVYQIVLSYYFSFDPFHNGSCSCYRCYSSIKEDKKKQTVVMYVLGFFVFVLAPPNKSSGPD